MLFPTTTEKVLLTSDKAWKDTACHISEPIGAQTINPGTGHTVHPDLSVHSSPTSPLYALPATFMFCPHLESRLSSTLRNTAGRSEDQLSQIWKRVGVTVVVQVW